MDYIPLIEGILHEVGEIAREQFGKVTETVKLEDANQVLTATDMEIGHRITQLLQEQFPLHNIIDEELGVVDHASEYTWVVDPIDGTSNFARGLPQYGCMLGLLYQGRPLAGGFMLPYFDELYVAERGKGTFCNGRRLTLPAHMQLGDSLISYGIDGHREAPEMTREECSVLAELILQIRNLRGSNSIYDMAMVLQGKYGAFINRTSKVWDNVAQQILLEEAGGVYTDVDGRAIDYRDILAFPHKNFTFIAASKEIHGALLHVLTPTF